MANLEISGKLIQKLQLQSGSSARGEWKKQDFIIEINESNYPSKVVFSLWGDDKVVELEKFNIGDNVKVSFNISSREYNSKWYTDLRAWKIEALNTNHNSYNPEDIPAGFTPNNNFSQQEFNNNEENKDDLPF